MADFQEILIGSEEGDFLRTPHSCRHCEVVLAAPSNPRHLTRLHFSHTISQGRKASVQGCSILEELLAVYDQRSLRLLFKTHLFRRCSCCSNLKQRLNYVFRSLSKRPFQLTLYAQPHGSRPESTINSFAYFDCGNGNVGKRFNAYTYQGDDAANLLPSFDREVENAQVISDLRKWISSCQCVHKSRASGHNSLLPTRLVDIGVGSSGENITVVTTSTLDTAVYVCLSYRWGEKQSVVLRSHNLEISETWTVLRANLPAAFRDAFKVMLLLGYRYIWIDALCIVQDDEDDVEHEILLMPHIYKGGDLTICASSSRSCHEGFLQKRPDYSESKINLALPAGGLGTIHLDSFCWWAPPVPEPLSTRAWVYQERLLSPRILEYGWRTVRWTCTCCARYSGFSGLLVDERRGKAPNTKAQLRNYSLFPFLNPSGIRHFPSSTEDLFSSWCAIVRAYSALKLTFPNDRLAAIGGVAAELQRVTGVRYLAGLWDHHRLPSLFQWKATSSLPALHPRPKPSRAPSWSWAGIDNEVVIHKSIFGVSGFRILTSDVIGGFGLRADGYIRLEGPARKVLWSHENKTLLVEPTSNGIKVMGLNGFELTVFPDCLGEIFEYAEKELVIRETELTLIAVGRAHSNQQIVRGVILGRDEIGREHYSRFGLFQAQDKGEFSICDWKIMKFLVI